MEYVVKSHFKEYFSDKSEVKTSWISGSNGSFFLSWPDSLNASCGYIVDWCPIFGNCYFEWMKVSPNRTHTTIFSSTFSSLPTKLLQIIFASVSAQLLLLFQRTLKMVGDTCCPYTPALRELRCYYREERATSERLVRLIW